MKKIVCELCDGTEFSKQDGMFVCQECGTKYTPEEAKAMMKEVEGEAPAAASSTPSVNSNQQQIDNLFVLATNAFESANNKEAEGYCNKIIEMDVTHYKAWILKGKAVGWQSTYGSPRVEEGANAMRKAVDFAPEEEKDNVAKEALDAIRNICNALANLTNSNFGNNPTEENRLKFGEFKTACANAIALFNDVSLESCQYATDVLRAHIRYAAEQMNLSGVAAVKMVRTKWNDIDYPNKSSWDTYLDWFGEIRFMFEDSIKWGETAGEDDKEIITRHKNRIIALEEPMDSKCYKQEWSSWSSSYEWVTDYYLSDSAKASRRKCVSESKNAIKKIENKAKEKEAAEKKAAEEAEKKRIADYWEAHKEEKEKLETEKKELAEKKNGISKDITNITNRINAVRSEEKEKLPAEVEEEELHAKVRELISRKSSLGIFAGKEKKQIAEEIGGLEAKIDALQVKIKEEKEKRTAEIENTIKPLEDKKSELSNEMNKINKRINAIDNKLSKAPKE